MEHVFASDCHRVVPNPFVLVHVAARRARQLKRGAVARNGLKSGSMALLALSEIAAGAFAGDELHALMAPQPAPASEDTPAIEGMINDETALLGGMTVSAAEAIRHKPSD